MTGAAGAVVLATPRAAERVAGLSLLVRAILTLRAAGVTELGVYAPSGAEAARRALARRGVHVTWLGCPADAAQLSGMATVVLIPGHALFDGPALADAARAVLSGQVGVLRPLTQAPDGAWAILCPPPLLSGLLEALEADSGAGEASADPGRAVSRLGVTATPLSLPSDTLFLASGAACPPAFLERILLDHLARRTTAGDSYLAALIDRRLSRPVTRLLLRWPVSPSQVTLASLLVGVVGAAGLATTSPAARVGGVLLLVASVVLDCVDGEVARARFEQSAAGARLDVIGDYVVHASVFLGLVFGFARQGLSSAGVWAALALGGGVAAAMLTMHLLFVRPALTRGGDLHWRGDAQSLHATPLASVVEKLASRDYTYLLLVLALLGHLEWFIYATAVGSWVFVGGLVLYRALRMPAQTGVGEGSLR